ncbi:MAG TPA: PEP-CTERM sorting domain-containing protein [Anaerolineae bacterium]|nr:PEP-CTERM sorting domain-containing protein [Anaerolineae bacterium]
MPGYGWRAGDPEPGGVYKVVVSGVESGEASATFEVLGEEFVPEPGSVILLGSGLMGLAGYAGLRYRRRR